MPKSQALCALAATLLLSSAALSSEDRLAKLGGSLEKIDTIAIHYDLVAKITDEVIASENLNPSHTTKKRKVAVYFKKPNQFRITITPEETGKPDHIVFDGRTFSAYESRLKSVAVSDEVPDTCPPFMAKDGYFDLFGFLSTKSDGRLSSFLAPSQIFSPTDWVLPPKTQWSTKGDLLIAICPTDLTFLKRPFSMRVEFNKKYSHYPSLFQRVAEDGSVITSTMANDFKRYETDRDVFWFPYSVTVEEFIKPSVLGRTITHEVTHLEVNTPLDEWLFQFDPTQAQMIWDIKNKIPIRVTE